MIWKIRVDTGGTFTDCRGEREGELRRVKLLSTGRLRLAAESVRGGFRPEVPGGWTTPPGFFQNFFVENQEARRTEVTAWEDGVCRTREEIPIDGWVDVFSGEEAPVLGARLLTGTGLRDDFPRLDFRLATTRGTNALLERKGAPLALFISQGFCDLLHIGDQRRGDLFALHHRKAPVLPRAVIEVKARLDATGRVLQEPDFDSPGFREEIADVLGHGIRVAAVSLLHSYLNAAHEERLREFLYSCGFDHVSIGSELAPLIKLLPRTQTAVANAYLHPVLDEFLKGVTGAIGRGNRVFTMTSAGGLEPVESFRPKDSLLSGPAGGVAGATAVARRLGFSRVITFDMGGTSTDVARVDGEYLYRFEQRVGDVHLLSTALKIETVASGGGSICRWTPLGLRVGPESAGADPGPACYGRGGPLTITDVNLLLGRIDRENFGIPLTDTQLVSARRAALALQAEAGLSEEELDPQFLRGLLDIAVEQMSDAIRTISVRDGADPADYALVAFGGAGPLHACAIAGRLGIESIVVPAEAGILSAYGLDRSPVERIAEGQVNLSLAEQPQIEEVLERIRTRATEALRRDGWEPDRIRRLAEVRLMGQDATLTLEVADPGMLAQDFVEEYESVFGYRPPAGRAMELVSFRVIVSADPPDEEPGEPNDRADKARSVFPREPLGAAAYLDRSAISRGEIITGPRTIQDPFSTLHLEEDWIAECREEGSLLLRRAATATSATSAPGASEEVRRELFRHRLEHVVTEMGVMLQRSAISTNVKERLDFSCALLDASGRLVTSAHHIPVHLGALGECVRAVRKRLPFRPGDTVVTNHPGHGGSHLPDVTVITPVFADPDGAAPVAFLANRAHHAEIGGITPGSMPPGAGNLVEEGVVIAPRYLVEAGESRFGEVEKLLTGVPHPTRNPADNLADLHAQLAANRRGVRLLGDLLEAHGEAEIVRQMEVQIERSARALRGQLATRGFSGGRSVQRLDDGTFISVELAVRDGEMVVDFAGTSERHPGNLNATPAIVRSAVLYVLRLWTEEELPLNEGLAEPVRIELPRCFLNPDFVEDPRLCPAVVGGNVETSQRVVDALIEAFRIQACSQGTMNNVIFGDESFGYYETIAGGAGAGQGYDGASALHTHMTNTAITDPEILESRYPVRLERFALRRGSGGSGRWRGGDGVIREMRFLRPVRLSLLAEHRRERPFGMDGGGAGASGAQFLDGAAVEGSFSRNVPAGTLFRIEAPGGGGYGL